MGLTNKIIKSRAIALGVVALVYLISLYIAYLVYDASTNKLVGLFKGLGVSIVIVILFAMLFDAIYERFKK